MCGRYDRLRQLVLNLVELVDEISYGCLSIGSAALHLALQVGELSSKSIYSRLDCTLCRSVGCECCLHRCDSGLDSTELSGVVGQIVDSRFQSCELSSVVGQIVDSRFQSSKLSGVVGQRLNSQF